MGRRIKQDQDNEISHGKEDCSSQNVHDHTGAAGPKMSATTKQVADTPKLWVENRLNSNQDSNY